MNSYAIETTGLQKRFGTKLVVDDLTLQVQPGEVFGFLGPNGAGKSTSVKMLLGLVHPSGGRAEVLGRPPGDQVAMARIGFLPEHFRFHEWLLARELLELHARLAGVAAPERARRASAVLERVGLAEHAARPLRGFSKGMLQRIGLAQALIAAPELIFLDEPTSALDPFGRMLVREIIRDLREQGATVFLNSHLLGEVEATCDRVTFIRAGRTLRTIALHELAHEQLTVAFTVDQLPEGLQAQLGTFGVVRGAPHPAANLPGVTIELALSAESQLPLLAAAIMAAGCQLFAFVPQRRSLEELFLAIVGAEDSGQ